MANTQPPQFSSTAGLQVFMGIFAHEVRTQLAGIISTCNYALHSEDPEFYLKAVAAGVNGSLQVLDNLLKAIQANNGYLHIATHLESFQLSPLLETICSAFDAECRIQRKAIKVDLPLHLEYEPILTDKLILTQVLYNLLTNALKWSYPHTSINILCRNQASALEIMVENTGNTIPSTKTALLFEPFYRLDNGYAGTGLGLYISHLYMEALGGNITVSSEDHHTSFTLTLPQLQS